MPYPERLGDPCWSPRQVNEVIQPHARTSGDSAAYFLAAHSPFKGIRDSRSNEEQGLSEEDVFQRVFSSEAKALQIFVKGEPGTGKSHLIRWMYERALLGAENGELSLGKYKTVLVRRKGGSLKEALEQIVEQLGVEFERHLSKVQRAIENLSDETNKAMLLANLAIEIETRWAERGHQRPLDPRLKHLGQALGATKGFGGWLKRDEGVIASCIRRLTKGGEFWESQTFPRFGEKEMLPDPQYRGLGVNSEQVFGFIEDLEMDEELRKLAASALNEALPFAIGELTSLKGSDLRDIFSRIRKELYSQGKQLAIFIEDVSVTQLDLEVITAFEPSEEKGQCRMVAILGITEDGWQRLPENKRQRARYVFEVGGHTAQAWVEDAEEVARFTARYLNTVRLNEDETKKVAKARFSSGAGKDLSWSKCDACLSRDGCFAAFGKVDLPSGISVGMFPFTPAAPQKLLKSLRLEQSRYPSQRELLTNVLLKALDQSERDFAERAFPRPKSFNVAPQQPQHWGAFEDQYCGGSSWDAAAKARMKFLGSFWVSSQNAADLATRLAPLLKPLGFPEFSKAARAAAPSQEPKRPAKQTSPDAPGDSAVEPLLKLLEEWRAGGKLRQDNIFRAYISQLLRISIQWEDQGKIPVQEVLADEVGLLCGVAYPDIEGQHMSPTSALKIRFDRGNETGHLLEALLFFDKRGDGTWSFEDSEKYRRDMSRWLRKHRGEILAKVQPNPPSLRDGAIVASAQALALAAILRDRKEISGVSSEAVNAILGDCWDENNRPIALAEEMRDLIEDLGKKHADLKAFLVQELLIGQGRSAPRRKDFIDPSLVLDAATEFAKKAEIAFPSQDAHKSFWKQRFAPVSRLKPYEKLRHRLEEEGGAIRGMCEGILSFLGAEAAEAGESLTQKMREIASLVGSERAHLKLPSDEFNSIWNDGKIMADVPRWAEDLEGILPGAVKAQELEVLCVDLSKIATIDRFIATAAAHLESVEEEVVSEEKARGGGDAAAAKELLDQLERISALAAPGSSTKGERNA